MRCYLKFYTQEQDYKGKHRIFVGDFNTLHAEEAGLPLKELQDASWGEVYAFRLINKWNSACAMYNMPYLYILTTR